MQKLFLMLIVVLVSSSCVDVDSSIPPQVRMESGFNPHDIQRLVNVSRDFSSAHSLDFELTDSQLLIIDSNGRDTIHFEMLFDGDPVLILTSVGDATSLMLISADYGNMPFGTLKTLVGELRIRLESELNLQFEHQMEPWTTNLTSG